MILGRLISLHLCSGTEPLDETPTKLNVAPTCHHGWNPWNFPAYLPFHFGVLGAAGSSVLRSEWGREPTQQLRIRGVAPRSRN
jgi:hypothetical protein